MTFDTVLRDTFPGAMDELEFVRATQQALQPLDFLRESTMVCVALVVTRFRSRKWTTCESCCSPGKTGFGAALHHAPQVGGRERYVFYAGPHVGIGPAGEPGVVERKGRPEPSTACGAFRG